MNSHQVLYWLHQAQQEQYAVGAFNANTLEQIQAVAFAAAREQAPVILQISHNALRYVGGENTVLGLQYFQAMGRIAASTAHVPFFLHLDHGLYHEVLWAIGLGFDSVMFDGGDLPLEENIRQTRTLCQLAHDSGIAFEAELGEVPKPGGSQHEELGELTDPSLAAVFVAETGIDSLAVAVGSVHGGEKKSVRLDLALLQEIADQVKVPLVLHGSSGVVDADLQASIQAGICKVNTATQSNVAFSGAVQQFLQAHPAASDPRKYLQPGREAMVAAVRERIQVIGASGKAAV